MMFNTIVKLILYNFYIQCYAYKNHHDSNSDVGLTEEFSWKQLTYDFDGNIYVGDTFHQNYSTNSDHNEIPEKDKFFIQYNNVPIGLEIYKYKLFVTVPRRRYGIPSTLNYINLKDTRKSPNLRPYPNKQEIKSLTSVYRPRVDRCNRLWVVDTGLLEVPNKREQIRKPSIVVYNLKTNVQLFRYTLKDTDLVSDKSSAGLTSITVDVSPNSCNDTHAYITDLATNSIIVFSLKLYNSWLINHSSFNYDPAALNFSVNGNIINWKDGIFSLALTDTDKKGQRTAFYHPLISTKEFSFDTRILKENLPKQSWISYQHNLGDRGPNSQSGSHAYHSKTKTLIFSNVAKNGISCWNIMRPLNENNAPLLVKHDEKLVYISDLKIVRDDVWILSNNIPMFVYSRYDPGAYNFYIHRGRVQDLIKGTNCEFIKLK